MTTYVNNGYWISGYAVGDETFVQLDGTSLTSSIDSVFARAYAVATISGVFVTGNINNVVVLNNAIPLFDGVYAAGIVGDVSISHNAIPLFDGAYATGVTTTVTIVGTAKVVVNTSQLTTTLGSPIITTVQFDYDSFASLYARTRTVYVDRKSTNKERTVSVMSQSRVVYVESRSTQSTRSVGVSY